MAHTICLLPGDGIGPEVTTAACQMCVGHSPDGDREWLRSQEHDEERAVNISLVQPWGDYRAR
jgi:isocitrate/isopropylmalate dehydrogenase